MNTSPEFYRSLWFTLGFLLIPGTPGHAAGQDLSRTEIDSVVERAADLIQSHYVFDERKPAITEYIRTRLNAGHYYGATNPDSLVEHLTRDLRSVSNDKHLYVEHATAGGGDDTDWNAWAERERVSEKLSNFGFTEARVLDGNVGYLRIVGFMHPQRGFEAAASAMRFLSNTEALVIDVQGNGGGYGGLMELVLSYFFDPAPTHISTTYTSNIAEPPTRSFTLPFVPGPRRVGQPLYVLINGRTGSAAEFFAYTLQAFGKATIVGEPSAGAAHRNTYFELDDRFRISISTGAPIDPVTGTNWEGTGVQPDLSAPAESAVCTAHGLALRSLLKDATDALHRELLEEAVRETGCS